MLSLREIASNRINQIITALPNNDAVQVKGLFIAPPGNIWTGFHTTFEGENKVFQKTKIPFYLNENPDSTTTVKAEIYNKQNNLINTVETKTLAKGLNYLIWKLDETSNTLPGAWLNDETRGIPVLPGDYKIVIKYKSSKDSSSIKIINDPRFSLNDEVDIKLYEYQKLADIQVGILSSILNQIDNKKKRVENLKLMLKDTNTSNIIVDKAIESILVSIDDLRNKGQTSKPKNRQVGAWQSFEVSPSSKLNDVLNIAAARTTIPSIQDLKQLEQATSLINNYKLNLI